MKELEDLDLYLYQCTNITDDGVIYLATGLEFCTKIQNIALDFAKA